MPSYATYDDVPLELQNAADAVLLEFGPEDRHLMKFDPASLLAIIQTIMAIFAGCKSASAVDLVNSARTAQKTWNLWGLYYRAVVRRHVATALREQYRTDRPDMTRPHRNKLRNELAEAILATAAKSTAARVERVMGAVD